MEERLEIGTKIYWITLRNNKLSFAESRITNYQYGSYGSCNILSIINSKGTAIPMLSVFTSKQEALDDFLKKVEALKGDLKDEYSN